MSKRIGSFFRPNYSTYIDLLDPISINKIKKGNGIWTTTKIVPVWDTETSKKVPPPPYLENRNWTRHWKIYPKYNHLSKNKCQFLLGPLRIAVTAIYRANRMSS